MGQEVDLAAHIELLADFGDVLSSSLEYERTLEEAARLVVPTVADWCAIDLVEPDGTLRAVGVAHEDRMKTDWARRVRATYPSPPYSPAAHVARTGEASVAPRVTDRHLAVLAANVEHQAALRTIGLASWLILPLDARDRIVGVLSLFTAESGRRFGDSDLAFGRVLAKRLALTIDNARLYADAVEARAARRQAEAALDALIQRPPARSGPKGFMLPSVGAATATVLLVEDSELVRELVERILEREGHRILAAEDGDDALRLAEGEPSIDLVITDVVMPRMSGPEFAAELRQRRPDVRVLFMSGHPSETLAREGLAVGEEFIQKPFTPSDLTAKVCELLERGDG